MNIVKNTTMDAMAVADHRMQVTGNDQYILDMGFGGAKRVVRDASLPLKADVRVRCIVVTLAKLV